MTFSLIGSLVNIITFVLATIGLPGLFALMAVESFGIPPIPSEVILPFAGFLVAEGTFPLGWTLVAAFSGGLLGAFIAYAVGRWWRHRLAGIGVGQLRLRPQDLARMDTWFARRGEATVALARVVPGVRSYISYPAGTARMDPSRFGVYTLLGSAPWTLALLYAGIVLGSRWTVVDQYFQTIDIVVVVALGLGVTYLVLLATGVLAYGWPLRRGPRYSGTGSRAPAEVSPNRPGPPTGP
ncbi:MAG: DedA family protein [Thermoplasmata archaeon]